DGVKVRRCETRLTEAPGSGQLGLLPGGEGNWPLAVLAAAEPFFLGSTSDLAVHDQRRGWVVEQGVDAENAQGNYLRHGETGAPIETRVRWSRPRSMRQVPVISEQKHGSALKCCP